jgi:hypothetical protein
MLCSFRTQRSWNKEKDERPPETIKVKQNSSLAITKLLTQDMTLTSDKARHTLLFTRVFFFCIWNNLATKANTENPRCVVEWVVSDVSKDRSACASRLRQWLRDPQINALQSFETSGTKHQTARCHIWEDTNPQQRRNENLKSRTSSAEF